ncbi:MAG: single-stranded-DNA-specific exonuclease RecJ [Butyricicoccaceae bacterium]
MTQEGSFNEAKRWVIASPDAERSASLSRRRPRYTPLTAAVLSARGIDTPQPQRADYLSCDVRGLHDPFGLTDMDKAVECHPRARSSAESKCVVYGDYDVDGITATCTLVDYLRTAGAVCEYYIPNRLSEGYGLTRQAMEELYRRGTRLMITVDSGITANEEIALARELGMKVVITDHHECHDELPEARSGHRLQAGTGDTYPFDSLAGVGVAFKLICALDGDTDAMLDRYADLVALGTVADVMPIVGENRIIVAEGLQKDGKDAQHRVWQRLLRRGRHGGAAV